MMGFELHVSVYDHTLGNAPHPVPNCEAKPQWAHLVLGWGTTRESCGVVRVFFVFSHIDHIFIMMIDYTVRVLRMRTRCFCCIHTYIHAHMHACPRLWVSSRYTPYSRTTYPHDRVMDARPSASPPARRLPRSLKNGIECARVLIPVLVMGHIIILFVC